MKKYFVCILILTLSLLPVRIAAADSPDGQASSLQDAAKAYRKAGTFDDQLALLSQLADSYAGELENSGWDTELRAECAEGLDSSLIPMDFEEHGYTEAEASAAFFTSLASARTCFFSSSKSRRLCLAASRISSLISCSTFL